MEELLKENQTVVEGQEKQFIQDQRGRIALLFEQLEAERQRKTELHDRLKAYNEVKQELAKKQGNEDQKLNSLLEELKEKKQKMQDEMESNMTVMLHKRAYEIDFDAY